MTVNREFLQFQQNLKKTALGVSFAKKLYLEPKSISPVMATKVMQELGFPVSKDLVLTAQATQAVVSGAAVVDRAKSLNSFTDYKEVIKPGVSSIAVLNSVANQLNLIDDKTSALLTVGLDIACIIASGGADIGAWTRVALAVGQEGMMAQARAEMNANKALSETVQGYIRGEQAALTSNLQLLQKGELGLFSFLAASVKDIPLLFPQLILQNEAFAGFRNAVPGLNFLPTGPWVFSANAEETTWYGEKKSADASLTIEGLRTAAGVSGTDYLLNFIIMPQTRIIMDARRNWLMRGKADIFNVALFAMFEKDFYLKQEMDLLESFIRYQVTPSDIGEYDTFNAAIDSRNLGVTSNFGLKSSSMAATKTEMMRLDQIGNIEGLRSDSQASGLLRKKFDFATTDIELQSKGFIQKSFDFRNMGNFIAVLDFLDLIYSDPAYAKLKQESTMLGYFDQLPRLTAFKNSFSDLYTKSLIRRVNNTALLNISGYTGIPLAKLISIQADGEPTIFKGT